MMKDSFEVLLKQLEPSQSLIKVSSKMFKTLWTQLSNRQQENKQALKAEIKTLETKKDKLIDKLVDTDSATISAAYEQRIELSEMEISVLREKTRNCGKTYRDYDESFRTALEFLSNPHKLWASKHYDHKRAVLRLTFSDNLVYDRTGGFRTVPIAQPFRLLRQIDGLETRMVDDTGLEPVTLAL